MGCPADSESLGRAGWTVLHTMARPCPLPPSRSAATAHGRAGPLRPSSGEAPRSHPLPALQAAYFPTAPSYAQQTGMGVFLRLFASFYPCRHCGQDFEAYLKTTPPATESCDTVLTSSLPLPAASPSPVQRLSPCGCLCCATCRREALSLWMCEAHNHVNTRLGKPAVVCTPQGLAERWRDGHASCDAEAAFDDAAG